MTQNLKNLSDSGFGSLNSNSNSNCIHGDSQNWRHSVNLPTKPNFNSPRLPKRHHDIFIGSKCKVTKASNVSTSNSSIQSSFSEKSLLPVPAQEGKSVNVKPETPHPQGKTPNRRPQKLINSTSEIPTTDPNISNESKSNTANSNHNSASSNSLQVSTQSAVPKSSSVPSTVPSSEKVDLTPLPSKPASTIDNDSEEDSSNDEIPVPHLVFPNPFTLHLIAYL